MYKKKNKKCKIALWIMSGMTILSTHSMAMNGEPPKEEEKSKYGGLARHTDRREQKNKGFDQPPSQQMTNDDNQKMLIDKIAGVRKKHSGSFSPASTPPFSSPKQTPSHTPPKGRSSLVPSILGTTTLGEDSYIPA